MAPEYVILTRRIFSMHVVAIWTIGKEMVKQIKIWHCLCASFINKMFSLDNAFLFVLIISVRTLWFWGESVALCLVWNCFHCSSFFKRKHYLNSIHRCLVAACMVTTCRFCFQCLSLSKMKEQKRISM